jgi:hypothetical protein
LDLPAPAQTVLSSQKNNFLFQVCPRAPLPAHAVRRAGFSTSEFESDHGGISDTRQPVLHRKTRQSKQAAVLALLSRPSGTTIAAIAEATGWQAHTVRGFLARVVRKRLGLTLQSVKTNGERVYRVIGNDADEPRAA